MTAAAALRRRLAELAAELAAARLSLGERHPRIRRIRAEMAETQRRLEAEPVSDAGPPRGEADAEQAEEARLLESIADLALALAKAEAAEPAAAELDRRADATAAVLARLREQEANLRRAGDPDGLRIGLAPLADATASAAVAAPRRWGVVAQTGALALLAGIALALALDGIGATYERLVPAGGRPAGPSRRPQPGRHSSQNSVPKTRM